MPAGPPVRRGPDKPDFSSRPYTAPLAQPAPAGAPKYNTKVDEPIRSDHEHRVISERLDRSLEDLLVDRARQVVPHVPGPPDGPPPRRLYDPVAPPYPPRRCWGPPPLPPKLLDSCSPSSSLPRPSYVSLAVPSLEASKEQVQTLEETPQVRQDNRTSPEAGGEEGQAIDANVAKCTAIH